MKDLLSDEELDPKKLFDKNEYNTLIIRRDGFSKGEHDIADLLESLFDRESSREQKETTFAALKKMNAVDLLVQTIRETGAPEQKVVLTSACWESGLDVTDHYLFFVDLACSEHFQLAFEAATVLENLESNPGQSILDEALKRLNKKNNPHPELLGELKEQLRLLRSSLPTEPPNTSE